MSGFDLCIESHKTLKTCEFVRFMKAMKVLQSLICSFDLKARLTIKYPPTSKKTLFALDATCLGTSPVLRR